MSTKRKRLNELNAKSDLSCSSAKLDLENKKEF